MRTLVFAVIAWYLIVLGLYAHWGEAAEVCPNRLLKVAVIDTGLDLSDFRFKDHICETGSQDFTGEGLQDVIGHGTHVAGLIKKYAGESQYCLMILKFYSENVSPEQSKLREVQALRAARDAGADIVNFSGGGRGYYEPEYLAIRSAPNTTFVVAAGNENENSDYPDAFYFPASYHQTNIISVGCLKKTKWKVPHGKERKFKCSFSNYGSEIDAWEVGNKVVSTMPFPMRDAAMSGTSMATAVKTGKLIHDRACQLTSWTSE